MPEGWLIDGHWLPVKDGDPRAVALYRRHYSCRSPRSDYIRYGITEPGESLVLLTLSCDALFVWHRSIWPRRDGQIGINCAVFRNESPVLSSLLIREAMGLAWQRWPGERLFTFVNPSKISSTNPGYCFLRAGWRKCGTSKRGLVILECLPEVNYPTAQAGGLPSPGTPGRASGPVDSGPPCRSTV